MRNRTPKRLLCRQTSLAPQPLPNIESVLLQEHDRPQSEAQLPPFNEALDRAWNRAVRNSTMLSLLLVKIEYCPYRKANWKFRTKEQLGQQITHILQGYLCNVEARIFRYAHRRFACILPQTNAWGVKSICDLLPITLRAIGIVPVMGATAVKPTPMDADPYFLIRATEAAIYQARQKKSLCCVLNATEPQLLAQRAYAKLSQMPNRDRVWMKLSSRAAT